MANPEFLIHNACAFPLCQWIPAYAWPGFNGVVGADGIEFMPTGPEMRPLNLLGVALVAVSAHSSWAGEEKSQIEATDPFMKKVLKWHNNRYLAPMGKSLRQIERVSRIRTKIKGDEYKLPTVVFADHTTPEEIAAVRSGLGTLTVQPTPELARVWGVEPHGLANEIINKGFAICYDTSQSWVPNNQMGLEFLEKSVPHIEEVHFRVSPDFASRLKNPQADYDQLVSGKLIRGSKLADQVELLNQAEKLKRIVVEVPAISHLVYGGVGKLANSVGTYRSIVRSLRSWFS